jgi:N-methylhydantoinase A
VIVPPSPATFSAWGMLTLDVVHDFSRTSLAELDQIDGATVRRRFLELAEQARAVLDREGIPSERQRLLLIVEMRYEGQEHTLAIPADSALAGDVDLGRLRSAFDAQHELVYGYSMQNPVEITTYRIRAVGTLEKPRRPSSERGDESPEQALIGRRRALHRESGGEFEWTVYDRSKLRAGNRLAGPAIVVEVANTTLVAPRQELVVDELGNLVISNPEEKP